MVTKLERSGSQPTSSPVARAPAPAPKRVSTLAPSVRDTVEAAETARATLAPRGEHVRGSADPGALWATPAPVGEQLDLQAFKKLSPADQQAALAKLEGERQSLRAQLDTRIGQLDRRWNTSRLSTRTEALREFQERAPGLDHPASAQLDDLVGRAEAAQRRINALRAKAATLDASPAAKQAHAAERQALAQALRAARKEQSTAVKVATATVDQQGLKIDRLASTEQIIDPTAPPPTSSTSLLGMLGGWFHLDWLFSAYSSVTSVVENLGKHQSKRRAAEREDLELEHAVKRLQAKQLDQKRLELSPSPSAAELSARRTRG